MKKNLDPLIQNLIFFFRGDLGGGGESVFIKFLVGLYFTSMFIKLYTHHIYAELDFNHQLYNLVKTESI